MKVLTPLLTLILISCQIVAQKNPGESFYLFDENFNGVKDQAKAAFFGRMQKISDTCWQWDFYNFNGPCIRRFQFKDEQQSVAHGKLIYYNIRGYFDSTGYAYNNLRQGDWYVYNDTGKALQRKHYENGKLISMTNIEDDQQVKDDSQNDQNRESSFPGGQKKWMKYLHSNMQYPERAQAISAQGLVIIQFIVDTKGKVVDYEISKSLEFSIDEEVTRLIRNSPDWQPGMKEGKYVKTYKKQPMIFNLKEFLNAEAAGQ